MTRPSGRVHAAEPSPELSPVPTGRDHVHVMRYTYCEPMAGRPDRFRVDRKYFPDPLVDPGIRGKTALCALAETVVPVTPFVPRRLEPLFISCQLRSNHVEERWVHITWEVAQDTSQKGGTVGTAGGLLSSVIARGGHAGKHWQ